MVQIPMPGKEEAVGSLEVEENLKSHRQRRHYSLGGGHHTDCLAGRHWQAPSTSQTHMTAWVYIDTESYRMHTQAGKGGRLRALGLRKALLLIHSDIQCQPFCSDT